MFWAAVITAITGLLSATVAFGEWLGFGSSADRTNMSADPRRSVSGGSSFLVRSSFSGKCVDVYGYSQDDAAVVVQYTCNGGMNQQWYWGDNSSLVNRFSGKCLDAYAFGTDNGTSLVQFECNGEANQRWVMAADGNGRFTLKSEYTGKCLDVYAFKTDDAAPLVIWACNGEKNQLWEAGNVV